MAASTLHLQGKDSFQEHLASLRDPLVLAFLDKLRSKGFAERTLRKKQTIVAAFIRWVRRLQILVPDLRESHLTAFLEHQPRKGKARWMFERSVLRLFLIYLHQEALVPGASPVIEASAASEILQRYVDHLRDERGLTKQSIYVYTPFARNALAGLEAASASPRLWDWNAEAVHGYLLERSRNRSCQYARLLRFLYLHGETAIDLSPAVSTVRKWRQVSVPTYLSPEAVEKVLSAPDVSTSRGRRDHAVLLLLARLGLRAGEVATLELGDILWRAGEIVVRGKGRSVDHLPLPPDVGEALAIYLREDRGVSDSRRVFLRIYAPRTGLAGPAAVGHIVRKLLARAGIIRTSRGAAHLFRHSLATRMIRHGASIPEIAEVLRHRSQNTTGIYAKVAFEALREVARPWPGSEGAR